MFSSSIEMFRLSRIRLRSRARLAPDSSRDSWFIVRRDVPERTEVRPALKYHPREGLSNRCRENAGRKLKEADSTPPSASSTAYRSAERRVGKERTKRSSL